NTILRSRARSSSPSSDSIALPYAPAISASAGCPRATRSRAATSASNTGAPCCAKRCAVALLPLAMPPVRAMGKVMRKCRSDQSEQMLVPPPQSFAIDEPQPARCGDEWAERNRRGAVVSAQGEEGAADDGADQRREQ